MTVTYSIGMHLVVAIAMVFVAMARGRSEWIWALLEMNRLLLVLMTLPFDGMYIEDTCVEPERRTWVRNYV